MKTIVSLGTVLIACAFANVSEAATIKQSDIRRRFTCAAPAQEVTHAMCARTAAIADIAQKEAERAASASDDPNKTRGTLKYWEIIADNLSKAGWSLGWVSAVDSEGQNDLDC